jgi:hypothetical protein
MKMMPLTLSASVSLVMSLMLFHSLQENSMEDTGIASAGSSSKGQAATENQSAEQPFAGADKAALQTPTQRASHGISIFNGVALGNLPDLIRELSAEEKQATLHELSLGLSTQDKLRCAQLMVGLDDADALQLYADHIESDPDPKSQAQLAEILKEAPAIEIETREMITSMAVLSRDSHLAAAAAEVTGRIADSETVRHLTEMFEHPDLSEAGRANLLATLRSLWNPNCVHGLAELFSTPPHPLLQEVAAVALVNNASPESQTLIINWLAGAEDEPWMEPLLNAISQLDELHAQSFVANLKNTTQSEVIQNIMSHKLQALSDGQNSKSSKTH